MNVARKIGLDPLVVVDRTNHKFIDRFGKLESRLKKRGFFLQDATLEQVDVQWNQTRQEG